MIASFFDCTLNSDVIISSSSATEGFHPSLDYIPGAKFWGIVAKRLYEDQDPNDNLLDFLYNGKVSFGDAHLVIDNERSLKAPLSWFVNKHDENSEVYLHHKVDDFEKLVKEGVQPKQFSNFFFNQDSGSFLKIDQDFAIKSAYDSNLRKSEDRKMYGYYGLPKGSKWRFSIESDNKDYLKRINEILEGTQRIGRSRSAQYGLVEIKHFKDEEVKMQNLTPGVHCLYAESDIILPAYQNLENSISGIDFDKSKIRTRIYQNWNTHRHTRDADRQVMVKGSVLVVNIEKEVSLNNFLGPFMERKSEGFGRFLVDPLFLTDVKNDLLLKLELKKVDIALEKEAYAAIEDKNISLIQILKKRKEKHSQVQKIDLAVNLFVSDSRNKRTFRAVTASQWGTVRSYAKLFPDLNQLRKELLADEKDVRKGYLKSGIAKDKWEAGISIIDDIVSGREDYPHPRNLFLEKLSAEMAKLKKQQKNS